MTRAQQTCRGTVDALGKLVEAYAADTAERYVEAVARLGQCDAAWQYAVRPTVEQVYKRSAGLPQNGFDEGVSEESSRPSEGEEGAEVAYRKGNADGRDEAIREAAAFLRGLPTQTLSPALLDAIASMIEANEKIASHREV